MRTTTVEASIKSEIEGRGDVAPFAFLVGSMVYGQRMSRW
jgi:hypothetical protein